MLPAIQKESTTHKTDILCHCPRREATGLHVYPPQARPHSPLTVDGERAATAVLAQLVLHQHAVLAAVLERAGGDDDGAHAAGGVVPELGVGRDVNVALVEGHRGPRVPEEGTGHSAVLATQHRVRLKRSQEAWRMAPVLLLIGLQLGAQVLNCVDGVQRLSAPRGPFCRAPS